MAIFLGVSYCLAGLRAGGSALSPARDSDRFTPFVATPHRVVEKMLELAGVGPDDTVYDLGSGDGRIVIAAAQKFGARAVGIEIRGELAEKSSAEIARLGLQKSARIIHGDMFDADLGPATVVTLYQLTAVNKRLRPLLESRLHHGARVVACDFEIPGWKPVKTLQVTSESGNEYQIFLYVRQ
ncbi:MAG: cyclopropane-fatty-acyl-phospholipid synthase family protein [Terriglobia bacterium]